MDAADAVLFNAVHFTLLDASEIIINLAIATLTEFAPVVDRDTRSDYQRAADQFAAALAHPDKPNSFRSTFEVIYDDLLANKTNWSHPGMIRKTYAAMRELLDNDNNDWSFRFFSPVSSSALANPAFCFASILPITVQTSSRAAFFSSELAAPPFCSTSRACFKARSPRSTITGVGSTTVAAQASPSSVGRRGLLPAHIRRLAGSSLVWPESLQVQEDERESG